VKHQRPTNDPFIIHYFEQQRKELPDAFLRPVLIFFHLHRLPREFAYTIRRIVLMCNFRENQEGSWYQRKPMESSSMCATAACLKKKTVSTSELWLTGLNCLMD